MSAPPSRPLIRYLGGKWSLAPWIIENMPPHRLYVEPFGGGGAVLLRKPRAYAEVYNDINQDVVNLFQVLRSEDADELIRRIELTPYSRDELVAAYVPVGDTVERARQLVVRAFMGRGSGSANAGWNSGFRKDGAKTSVAREWASYPDALRAVVSRLRGVVIENRDAVEVIRQYDAPDAVMYLDPPYVHATRKGGEDGAAPKHTYQHDLDDEGQERLLDAALAAEAMVMLAGYDNALYAERLSGWKRLAMDVRDQTNKPRSEVMWLNPSASAGLVRLI